LSSSEPIVVGIGELLWDQFPDGDRIGGAPANFAYHAAQLGAESYIISRVGSDASGDLLVQNLKSKGPSLQYLQEDRCLPTGMVSVDLKHGQPTYVIHHPAAWDSIEWNQPLQNLATRVNAVAFGTLAQRTSESKNTIRTFLEHCPAESIRLFDINLRQNYFDLECIESSLQLSNALKLNIDELKVIAQLFRWSEHLSRCQLIQNLFDRFPLEHIALTLGSEGCELFTRERSYHSKAPKIQCLDAVGAGDAFAAALACGLLQKKSLNETAHGANRIGAFVASQAGAMPDLPQELRQL
jgi:fructokinase